MKNSELQALRRRIDRTERSAAKVALLEEAIGLADSHNDVESGFELRRELVDTAQFTGHPEKSLVAFSWMLAQADRDPDRFDDYYLLWQYKWVVNSLDNFPQIGRRQIEDAVADLARRSERFGSSQRHVYSVRCQLARDMGDGDDVRTLLAQWKKTPRDFLSDCQACDLDSLISTHIYLGHDRRALQVAGPILKGTMHCTEVPHVTYAQVLLSLVRVGRLEEAAECHRKGYALVRNNEEFIPQQAEHLIYMVLARDLKGAVQLVERHLGYALHTAVPLSRYYFYRSCAFLFRHLKRTPRSKRKLRLPEDFPLGNATGTYDSAQLEDWFEVEARALAAQFDARNGNRFRTDEMNELAALDSLVVKMTG